MNYKHLDEKKKAQIDVLFNLHYSMREIGRQLDISHSSVSRYLRKTKKQKKIGYSKEIQRFHRISLKIL